MTLSRGQVNLPLRPAAVRQVPSSVPVSPPLQLSSRRRRPARTGAPNHPAHTAAGRAAPYPSPKYTRRRGGGQAAAKATEPALLRRRRAPEQAGQPARAPRHDISPRPVMNETSCRDGRPRAVPRAPLCVLPRRIFSARAANASPSGARASWCSSAGGEAPASTHRIVVADATEDRRPSDSARSGGGAGSCR